MTEKPAVVMDERGDVYADGKLIGDIETRVWPKPNVRVTQYYAETDFDYEEEWFDSTAAALGVITVAYRKWLDALPAEARAAVEEGTDG